MLSIYSCGLLAICRSLEKCLFRSNTIFLFIFCFFDIEQHKLIFANAIQIKYLLHICIWNNPLSVVSFSNIFPHFEDCLFIVYMASFAVQKLISLIRSHLFTYLFYNWKFVPLNHLPHLPHSILFFCLFSALWLVRS